MSEVTEPSGGSAGRLGKYELLQETVASGVAATFLARTSSTETDAARTVSILRLHRHATKSVEPVEQLVREARRAHGIHHPNVVPILEIGVGDAEIYIVSEHVPGLTLAELVEGAGAEGLPLPVLLRIMLDALEGLGEAHEQKPALAHGELGPFSILVGEDGVTRLNGLGVAHPLSRLGLHGVRGYERLAYAAPERVKAMATPATDEAAVDPRSDVYAMGVMLWEGIARKRLISSRIEAAVVQRVAAGGVGAPSIPAGVNVPEIVLYALEQALDRDPKKRFADARELSALVQTVGASRMASTADVAAFVAKIVAAQTTSAPGASFVAIENPVPERKTMPYGQSAASLLGDKKNPAAGRLRPPDRGTLPFGKPAAGLVGGINLAEARAALNAPTAAAPAAPKAKPPAPTAAEPPPKAAEPKTLPPPDDDDDGPERSEDASLKLDWEAPLAHLSVPRSPAKSPSVLPHPHIAKAPASATPPPAPKPAPAPPAAGGKSFELKSSQAAVPAPTAKAAPPPAPKPAAKPPLPKPPAAPPPKAPAATPAKGPDPIAAKPATAKAEPTAPGPPLPKITTAAPHIAKSLEELVADFDDEPEPPSRQPTARHQVVSTGDLQRKLEGGWRLGGTATIEITEKEGPPSSEMQATQRVPSLEALAEVAASSTDKLLPGDLVDRYELLLQAERHAGVATWAARIAGSAGRVVALHVRGLPEREQGLRDLFARCAAFAAKASHPNIAEVLDFGETEDLVYVVSEWIDGASLDELRAAAGGSLPLTIAARFTADLAAALQVVHELGPNPMGARPVHGAICPRNVLVTRAGVAKLRHVAHFGPIASPVPLVSPPASEFSFRAPEQNAGISLDRRADVYALGSVFQCLVTGRAPSPDTSLPEGGELAAIVARAMSPQREARFATTADMRLEIERALGALGDGPSDEDLGAFVQTNLADFLQKHAIDLGKAVAAADNRTASTAPKAPTPKTPAASAAKIAIDASKAVVIDETGQKRGAFGAPMADQLTQPGSIDRGEVFRVTPPAARHYARPEGVSLDKPEPKKKGRTAMVALIVVLVVALLVILKLLFLP